MQKYTVRCVHNIGSDNFDINAENLDNLRLTLIRRYSGKGNGGDTVIAVYNTVKGSKFQKSRERGKFLGTLYVHANYGTIFSGWYVANRDVSDYEALHLAHYGWAIEYDVNITTGKIRKINRGY